MRKTHWMCMTVGMCLGFVAGVGLIILQMKYGTGPVTGDITAQADGGSVLEEPKVIGGEDDPSEDDPTDPEALPAPRVEQTPEQTTNTPTEEPGTQEATPGAGEAAANVAEAGPANTEPEPVATPPHAEAVTAPEPIAAPQAPPTTVTPAAPIIVTLPEEHKPARRKHHEAQGPVPYIGNYDCTLDEQGGLTLPAEVHEILDTPRPRILYIAPAAAEHTLWVFTASGLRRFVRQRDALPASEKEEKERRLWYSKVAQVDVGADGHFQIPMDLIDDAGLKKDLVLVGVNDHFEIWDADRWDAYTGAEPGEGMTLTDVKDMLETVIEHVVGKVDVPLPVNVSSPDPAERMKELLNGSDESNDARQLGDEPDRVWYITQPSHLNPQRIHGGIQ
jgi:MraZ protein